MKKKFLYITTFVCGLLGATACDDMLDTEALSTDNLEYLCSNPTDARKMVAHVYSYMCEDTYTSRMSTNWMQNTDIEIGFVKKSESEGTDRRGVWCLNMKQFNDIKNAWDNTFKAIDFANQCIQGIEGSAMYQSGDKDMKQLHGEAYCLRAYWYWLMCNFWADVPFATTPTTSTDMHNDPRTDKNIIYAHCIQDLINVEEEMQWSDEITVEYMNREFALGFITKLAMFRAGYSMQADGTMSRCDRTEDEYNVTYVDVNGVEQKTTCADDFYKVAQAYAQKLINLKGRSLNPNFKEIFDNQINGCNPGNGDVLYEVAFVPNAGGDIGWCHGMSVVSSTKGAGTSYTYLTPSYVASFDSKDLRLPVTCANYRWLYDGRQAATDAFNVQPAKWCRLDLAVSGIDSKGTGINWPVLRYSDVLLLLAEAENEINHGPTETAKNMLRTVRNRAFSAEDQMEKVENYISGLNNYDKFKQAIINERAWEFGGENIRKFDLIRWNYYSDAIVNTIEWMREVAINYQQLEQVGDELIYNKEKEIVDMGVAPRLYYNYINGEVVFENDYFTYRDRGVSPYKEAESLKDDDINKAGSGATFDGLKYVGFIDGLISVSSTDPETNKPYGKDENGDDIKKGVVNERVVNSWYGLTNGTLVLGTEDIESLRKKVTPYVFPIPTDRIMSSNGVLSNDGYAIRNK